MDKNLNLEFVKLKKRLSKLKSILYINNSLNVNFDIDLFKEYSSLLKVKNKFLDLIKYENELNSLKDLKNDIELCNLVKKDKNRLNIIIKKIKIKLNKYLFINKYNKNDKLDVYLEIYSGTGGNEACLFVSDLFKMYNKYSEIMNWKVELISFSNNIYKGYKYIIVKIIGNNVYKYLKYESGGHRVQRVPKTESQGRIHTSTCIVAVIPVVPLINLPIINNNDIKVDTFRSSGAGGQHVNTTDSAVRITHIPTGIVVECQKERSQHKNKSKALEVLKSRVYNFEKNKVIKENSLKKKNLLGSGYRNDRNRTYNFSQNRVTDHRINLNIYSLDKILNGNLNLLLKPLIKNLKHKLDFN